MDLLQIGSMTDPKTLGPRADKVLKENIWIYGDLSACLLMSIESTLRPLIEELGVVDNTITQHDMDMTLKRIDDAALIIDANTLR